MGIGKNRRAGPSLGSPTGNSRVCIRHIPVGSHVIVVSHVQPIFIILLEFLINFSNSKMGVRVMTGPKSMSYIPIPNRVYYHLGFGKK